MKTEVQSTISAQCALLKEDVQYAWNHVSGSVDINLSTFEYSVETSAIAGVKLQTASHIELLFMSCGGYPGSPPLLFLNAEGQGSEQLTLSWDLSIASTNERLRSALGHSFIGSEPYVRTYGPNRNCLLTTDRDKALAAGWNGYFGNDEHLQDGLESSLFQRSMGLLSDSLLQKTVMIVGVGSGGSYLAQQLVRSGVGCLILIDPDRVEAHNLSRTTYMVSDIGELKVMAMRRQLMNINPTVLVETYPCAFHDMSMQDIRSVFEKADLVLALTDDPQAQYKLDHFCYHYDVDGVFASLYRGAKGGEVILALPGRTPCLHCAIGNIRDLKETVEPDMDYGTGRLNGEVALAADIHHVDSATLKLALSLLMQDEADVRLGRFVQDAVTKGFSFLCLSMEPEYWIFPKIFPETIPGQHGYQSFWINVERDPCCCVCGDPEYKEDPTEFALRTPRIPPNRKEDGNAA